MATDIIISSRPDREIRKKIVTAGDYNLVPYEDSKCSVIINDVVCTDCENTCDIEPESRYFSPDFNGELTIGDSDNFIDKDLELIIEKMCKNEVCLGTIVYNNNEGKLVKKIECKIELKEVSCEDLVSDWPWDRLFNTSFKHKERGVQLVRENRFTDAVRRFNKALKLLVAIEPLDPEVVPEEKIPEMIDLRVKIYNNLAHCQLHYNEYDATLELCSRALKHDPDNVKALYRRSLAYLGLKMYEEAMHDVQKGLKLEPKNKSLQEMVKSLEPKITRMNIEYKNTIKKMFG